MALTEKEMMEITNRVLLNVGKAARQMLRRLDEDVFETMTREEYVEELEDSQGCCYVYFIRNEETKKIKIGMSIDVDKRAKDLRTACGCALSIIGVMKLKSVEGARLLEKNIHKTFEEHRVNTTEWFDGIDSMITPFEIKSILDQVNESQGMAFGTKEEETIWGSRETIVTIGIR